jgi:hypothetical protein
MALSLDPWHAEANRLILNYPPEDTADKVALDPPTTPLPKFDRSQVRQTEFQRRASRHKRLTRYSCLMGLLLQMCCGLLTLGLIGVFPGVIGAAVQLFNGPQPTTEIDGKPIETVEDAIARIEPMQSQPAVPSDVDMLDHGYVHEYSFEARRYDEVFIYVQFMSVQAHNVQRNVRIFDPSGAVAPTNVCVYQRDSGPISSPSNAAYICDIQRAGTWTVRILGVENESVGAYFIGVEKVEALS